MGFPMVLQLALEEVVHHFRRTLGIALQSWRSSGGGCSDWDVDHWSHTGETEVKKLAGGFQIFYMFTPTWGNDPIWLIFFKWVETTNQKMEDTPPENRHETPQKRDIILKGITSSNHWSSEDMLVFRGVHTWKRTFWNQKFDGWLDSDDVPFQFGWFSGEPC